MDLDWCLVCDSKIPFSHDITSAFCSRACLAKAEADARSRTTSPIHSTASPLYPQRPPPYGTPWLSRPSRGEGSRRPNAKSPESVRSGASDESRERPDRLWRLSRVRSNRRIASEASAALASEESEAPSFSTLDTSAPSDGGAGESLFGLQPTSEASRRQSNLAFADQSSLKPSETGPESWDPDSEGRSTSALAEDSPSASAALHWVTTPYLASLPLSVAIKASERERKRGSASAPPTHATRALTLGAFPSVMPGTTTSSSRSGAVEKNWGKWEFKGSMQERFNKTAAPLQLERAGLAGRLAKYSADVGRVPPLSALQDLPLRASQTAFKEGESEDVYDGEPADAELDAVAQALQSWGGLVSSQARAPLRSKSSPPYPALQRAAQEATKLSSSVLFRTHRERHHAPIRRRTTTTGAAEEKGKRRSLACTPTTAVNSGRERDPEQGREWEWEIYRDGARKELKAEAEGNEGDAEEESDGPERRRGRSRVQRRVVYAL